MDAERRLRLLSPLFAALSLLASQTALAQRSRPETERLELAVGEQVTLSAANVASYSEGAPGIVDVRLSPDGSQFIIVALQRPGTTSLLLIFNDGHQVRYSIQVLDPQASVTSTGGVPVRDNIRLDLYFVQLQERYTHQIGIGFPGTIGGTTAAFTTNIDVLNGVINEASIAVSGQALPRLDIGQSSGWFRLLRQAVLVTANGTEATLNSGGEVNVQITSALTTGVRRIQFGTILTMTPRYDSGTRRIEIALRADVSELTPPEFSGIPGRTRTTLATTVNLELGQSIMLGGLTLRNARQSQTGLPGLSQIPILGVLFGTNARDDTNQESLLFIVPTVVQAVPRASSDRIAEALRIYESFGSIGGPGLGDVELIEPTPPGYE